MQHETTSPDTPEHNCDTEQQNQTIFDHVWTVLIDVSFLYLYLLKPLTISSIPKIATPLVH